MPTKNEKPLAAPQGTLQGPAIPVAEIVAIPIDEIEMGERLRPVDIQWAGRLGQIMLTEGQRTPIEVCRLPGQKKYTLVSGGHRLAAAQMFFDLSPIKAVVVSNDAIDRRLAEVSENLWRRDLDPFDRAAFIADLVAAHKLKRGIDPNKDGRTASIQARWQQQLDNEAEDTTATIASVYGWSEDVGEKLGLSARTVRNDLMIYRRIAPSVIGALRDLDHPAIKSASELRAIAKLPEDEQKKVVGLLLSREGDNGDWFNPKVSNALAVLRGKSAPRPEAKRFDTIISTLARMSNKERLALVQSADFQALLPKKASDLLMPIRKGGGNA